MTPFTLIELREATNRYLAKTQGQARVKRIHVTREQMAELTADLVEMGIIGPGRRITSGAELDGIPLIECDSGPHVVGW